ncbi:aspartate/glutamate racemase family protein [Priestia megaterium]|uniref:aspartate/glutamate racemase family protein n=1 Tax=Priestia megaterium TaxID=1404 RepID=UPI0021F3EA80|nr:aspartate/glutamate racemase family protein [Priestia megaterium]UYP07341.1 aspartate/glutamate racemase family protein [Priestia megaterium]
MTYRIGLVHATLNAVKPMNDAFRQYAPETICLNFLNEGLIQELNETGNVTPEMVRRLGKLIESASLSNVDGVLLTCSSFTPYVDLLAPLFNIPVISVDYAMLDRAVSMGNRIGLIATVAAAGPTSEQILKDIAEEKGKSIVINTEIISEAFAALQKGDEDMHDMLIQQKIKDLSNHCDVVVVAQISMIRALRGLRTLTTPVLTSPEISIKSILSKLDHKDTR